MRYNAEKPVRDKINEIVTLRRRLGWGLRETKDFVEPFYHFGYTTISVSEEEAEILREMGYKLNQWEPGRVEEGQEKYKVTCRVPQGEKITYIKYIRDVGHYSLIDAKYMIEEMIDGRPVELYLYPRQVSKAKAYGFQVGDIEVKWLTELFKID